MARSNGHWHQDILTEILFNLPVKSIIRFKCVSKTWYRLFQNPTFVSRHLGISKKNPHLLVPFRSINNIVTYKIVDETGIVPHHDLLQQLPPHLTGSRVFDVCVCNGLVCFCDDSNSRITLWNPATREFRVLPQYYDQDQNVRPLRHIIGLGLDNLSNDYKVVHIQNYSHGKKCAVYRMTTDSWRVLEEEDFEFFKDFSVRRSTNNACVNGVHYWQMIKVHDLKVAAFRVLAFHLSTENFQLIEPPVPQIGKLLSIHDDHDDRITIWDVYTTRGEMLEGRHRSNEVWVLNNDGSWTLLWNIHPNFSGLTIRGFLNNDAVFVESKSGRLLLSDGEVHKLIALETENNEPEGFSDICNYEESLVPVRSQ